MYEQTRKMFLRSESHLKSRGTFGLSRYFDFYFHLEYYDDRLNLIGFLYMLIWNSRVYFKNLITVVLFLFSLFSEYKSSEHEEEA